MGARGSARRLGGVRDTCQPLETPPDGWRVGTSWAPELWLAGQSEQMQQITLTLQLVFATVVRFALLLCGLIMIIALSSVATASSPGVAVVQRVLRDALAEQSSGCDSNYSGCVPIASDVDCAGGSGNGPAYVQGPVTVIGKDIYDLDSDGDGVACERK